jgi:hypothetical protein
MWLKKTNILAISATVGGATVEKLQESYSRIVFQNELWVL